MINRLTIIIALIIMLSCTVHADDWGGFTLDPVPQDTALTKTFNESNPMRFYITYITPEDVYYTKQVDIDEWYKCEMCEVVW